MADMFSMHLKDHFALISNTFCNVDKVVFSKYTALIMIKKLYFQW